MIKASFGKLILDSMFFEAVVFDIGAFIASFNMDQISVPANAYKGYATPVSVNVIVPELLRKIHTNAVVSGVINAHNIPKYD
jgi:hypothetical protein